MSVLDKKTRVDDEITRPSYYGGPDAPYEPVKVIDQLGLGPGFYFGSALKYLQRAPHKGSEMADLKKAAWYLTNGVRLGYTMDPIRTMSPPVIVSAWKLSGDLGQVALLILRGDVSAASSLLCTYLR
jgi:hypothetical protein